MFRILFVCHGNICRSAAAKYVMQDLLEASHLTGRVLVDSAATSTEELGNPVYPPMRRTLAEHGISCDGHRARQIRRSDYDHYDMIIGSDIANMRNMERMLGGDPDGKFHLLLDFSPDPARHGDAISDPWYTRDFELAYADVEEGCRGLLAYLQESGAL